MDQEEYLQFLICDLEAGVLNFSSLETKGIRKMTQIEDRWKIMTAGLSLVWL